MYLHSATATNAQQLDLIDSELESLQSIRQVLTGVLTARETRLRRRRVSLAPIHRLPHEVLVKIIHFASHPDGDWTTSNYVLLLHDLAQVCSIWAANVRDTPTLWTLVELDVEGSDKDWETALTKSQSSLVAVRFCAARNGRSKCHCMPESFWSAVTQHSFRWAALEVCTKYNPMLTILDNVNAPHLQRLKIDITESPYKRPVTPLTLTLCAAQFPKVSSLELSGVEFATGSRRCCPLYVSCTSHTSMGHPWNNYLTPWRPV